MAEPVHFQDFSISMDDSSFCWSLSATLADLSSWATCIPGTLIEIQIGSDIYSFKVDSRNRSTSYGEEAYSVEARSPSSDYAIGSVPLNKTWGASNVSLIAEELFPGIIFQMDDWMLPANTLTADGETAVEVLSILALARNGGLYSTTEGTLVLTKAYKTPPTELALDMTDHIVSDLVDIYTLSDTKETHPGYDLVYVSDQPESGGSISIEEIEIDTVAYTSTLKVTVFPFAEAVQLQSSYSPVVIPESTVQTEEEIEEWVEIIDGTGNTDMPVFSVIDSYYQDFNLGTFTTEGNSLATDIEGTSLMWIKYTTKYHVIEVNVGENKKVQIYTTGE